MCVGVPLRLISSDGMTGVAGTGERVDLSLTGPLPAGTHVLCFLGAAREVLTEERAALIARALAAVEAAQRGERTDAFADIEARAPRLPPHLEAARRAGARIA